MNAIDKIMQRLGNEYAEESTAGKYKATPGKNATISDAVVYYLNSQTNSGHSWIPRDWYRIPIAANGRCEH